MLRLLIENILDREGLFMTKWIECKISDIGTVVGGATPSTKKPENYEKGKIAWITPKDLSTFSGRYIERGERNITEIGLKSCSTQLMPKNTVLFSSRAPIGYVAIAANEICTNQGFKSVIPNENTNSLFLYYLLKYNKDRIESMGSGTTFKEVSGNTMKNIVVFVPDDKKTQGKIASILGTIDDKIEENRRINNNLSEQSQAIFTKFMDSYPYALTPLGDFAEIIDCLHSKKPEAVDNTTFQLLQLNNITDSGFLDLSSKYYISKSDYENWTRKCEIVEGDCVITNVGRIGAVSQAPVGTHTAMGRNMTCIRLKKDKPFHSYLITTLLSNHIRKEVMKNTDEGTIMGALNVKNIPLLLFPMFDTTVMFKLEEVLSPIRKTIEQNYLSNQTLAQMRDTLLPKLMSGELDVAGTNL